MGQLLLAHWALVYRRLEDVQVAEEFCNHQVLVVFLQYVIIRGLLYVLGALQAVLHTVVDKTSSLLMLQL